ncbi:hypothetical protein [Methanosphaera sp. BMS]|uniref:hypothetical protein n=1 Tax=Methanosphaera sp. BMS TaxID=1789762 RepID=UPI000DC1C56A|nr:hypothetical protein [Methanosphaera sp. BMS]AWX32200.1 hypothetical protein AW729_03380 [Methanosphaera sp. BMS]
MNDKITIKILIEWIGILVIFSIISAIGNVIGYHYPFIESLIGMLMLCGISLAGLIIERYVPWDIPSILYISLIGLILALPISPVSGTLIYYTSRVELISLTTVLLAYAGISMGKDLGDFKKVGVKGVVVTFFVIFGTYVGSALIAQVVLMFTGMI